MNNSHQHHRNHHHHHFSYVLLYIWFVFVKDDVEKQYSYTNTSLHSIDNFEGTKTVSAEAGNYIVAIIITLNEKNSIYIHAYIHTDRQTDRQT